MLAGEIRRFRCPGVSSCWTRLKPKALNRSAKLLLSAARTGEFCRQAIQARNEKTAQRMAGGFDNQTRERVHASERGIIGKFGIRTLSLSMLNLAKHLPESSGLDLKHLLVEPGRTISLRKDFDPKHTGEFKAKMGALAELKLNIERLSTEQDVLYAGDTYALLLVFQALDAAGKDGTIKHVMSGVNPQGCEVSSFKAPSHEELDHDYLWRTARRLPQRGRIGIFNRSYYEEVLVVRVHPELLAQQHLPPLRKSESIWSRRFEEINSFERYLVSNGIIILKFFLNVSKSEQKSRFLKRIEQKEKNWKFSAADIRERQYWDDYMEAYEEMFNRTSTDWAPWFIIPADHKWFTRLCVSEIIVATLKSLGSKYPKVSEEELAQLEKAKAELLNEK
jgi:PPK2 family polyphosphate:nucleotide phosphotransferase